MIVDMQVPHIGFLTNGVLWNFVRYNEVSKQFIKSETCHLPLTPETTTFELKKALHRIVARMVPLLRDHVNAVDAMVAFKKTSHMTVFKNTNIM
jgi:hypothetical protein